MLLYLFALAAQKQAFCSKIGRKYKPFSYIYNKKGAKFNINLTPTRYFSRRTAIRACLRSTKSPGP